MFLFTLFAGVVAEIAVAQVGANGCWMDCAPTAYAVGYMLPSLPGLFDSAATSQWIAPGCLSR